MKKLLLLFVIILTLLIGSTAFATTRALQFDALLAGLMDDEGNPLSAGVVYFYEAGTTTAKNIWTDKDKTAPYTYVTLGTDGRVHIYGDGLYKVVVKKSDGTTYETWDNVYIGAANYYMQIITGNLTATTSHDFIMCNTNSGTITVTLPSIASGGVDRPLTIKRNGTNTVVIDGAAAETVDGSATYTISSNKRSVTVVSDGTNWQISAVPVSSSWDSDSDTGIQVDEGAADDDTIRFDVGGTEQVTIQDGAILPTTDNDIDLGNSGGPLEFKNAYFDGTVTTDTIVVSDAAGEGVGSDFVPTTDDTYDLGGTGYEWKDLYVDGTAYIDSAEITTLTFGATTTDTLIVSTTAGEGVGSDLVPTTDDTYDLGNTSYKWKDLFIDGTATIDRMILGATSGLGVASDINPFTDGTYDLGNTTYEWQDLFIDGTATIDTLVLDYTAGLGVGSDTNPTADGTYDLGSTSREWQDLWIDGTANIDALIIGADDLTAEMALLSGLTATASEINIPLDGALVTLAEFQQLETIGATTISANQWAALGGIAETLTATELNTLDGVAATLTYGELNILDGVTATAAQINNAIGGDGTVGRVLRSAELQIGDTDDDGDLDCALAGSIWNGDTIGSTADITKGNTVGNFHLSADGVQLTILAAGLTGNAVGVPMVAITTNKTGVDLYASCTDNSNNIICTVSGSDGVNDDLTVITDAVLEIAIRILYVTSQ